MSQPASIRIVANALEQHLYEWSPGEAGRGTAFLIHGFLDGAATWDLVAPALAAHGLRVLAPDMRGFGDGPRAPSGSYYHFVDYVFDAADMIDALAPEGPLYVVGHSMGGVIASLYAGTFPERPTKLALLEGLGPPDSLPSDAPLRTRNWIDQVRAVRARDAREGETRPSMSLEDARRRLAMNHPGVPPDVLATRVAHLTREIAGQIAWKNDPLHRTTSPTPFFAQVYSEFAKRIACPVLFVSGGERGFHPPDEAERIASFASLARETIPDAGHMMHWTRPRELSEILTRFWDANP